MITRRFGQILKSLFVAPSTTCMLCNKQYSDKPFQTNQLHMLCASCNLQLHYIKQSFCRCCGREVDRMHVERCRDCSSRQCTYFISNRSAVRYTPIMRDWIYTYKFHGREHLVIGLIELLEKTYREHYRDLAIDAITFIPLHKDRLYERRFNQAEQLAEGLARKVGLPLISTLIRTRDTLKQSHQNRNERLLSILGAFQGIENTPAGRSILLIDDIYTTGSTINEAAMVLHKQGWQQIYACTVARA